MEKTVSKAPKNKHKSVIKTNLIFLKIKNTKQVKKIKEISIAKIKEFITTSPAFN